MCDNGDVYSSQFDKIFFSVNLSNLLIFLNYLNSKSLNISISGIEDFLKRQTRFSRKQALNISFEDNQMENKYPELLEYDENLQVVRIKQFPIKKYSKQREQKKELGISSKGGCPFAKSKGVEKNSFEEHFDYFNNILLDFLKQSKEFEFLFSEK